MGLGLGAAESVTDDVVGIAEFISNPAAAYEGFKALLSNPDVVDAMTDAVVQSYEMRLAKIEYALEVGGDHNAVMLGDELASLAYDFGSLLSGIKAGAITLPKLAAQAGDVAVEVARQTASKADNVIDGAAEVSADSAGAMRVRGSEVERTTNTKADSGNFKRYVEREQVIIDGVEAKRAEILESPNEKKADEVNAANRLSADKTRIEANISENRAARQTSGFSDFIKAEGQVQENLQIWPPNKGQLGPVSTVELQPGTLIDRYGSPRGSFVAPQGTSFSERALPSYYEDNVPFFQYEVVKPLPNATQSKVLPWFGQKGLGIQFELEKPIQWYLDNGFLEQKN